jgi:carboxypeptidase Q
VVLWTAEEVGLMGATAYRDAHRAEVDKHVLAMESDNGVFRPRALLVGAGEGGLAVGQRIASLLSPIGVDSARAGGPQADISPLFALGVPVATIDVDPSRYFWYHHSDGDTIDKLDPVDLARNTAIFAVVANVVANMDGTFPRTR